MSGDDERIFPPKKYAKYFKGMVIIIVDDEPKFIRKLKPFITDLGIECKHYEDGIDVLKYLENMKDSTTDILLVVDLLFKGEKLSDWKNLGGYKLIKDLRGRGYRYPIVIMSQYIIEDSMPIREFEKLDIVNILQKVSAPHYLADAILASFFPYLREQKKIEREKLTMKENIRKAIYHQLFPPIDLLSSKLSNLEMKYPGDKELFESVRNHITEIKRTKKLDDDIAKFITNHKLDKITKINLRECLNVWKEHWVPSEDTSKKIKIVLGPMPERDVMARASTSVLNVVMDNLVSNAAWAMRDKRNKEITVSILTDRPGYTDISVRDSGYGFSDTVMDKLFKEKITSRENENGQCDIENHGAGLSICKQLVTSMLEGFLIPSNLRDEKGNCIGADVRIRLPLYNEGT